MLTVGRSGSSMFAGIFHLHGVFTGRIKAGDRFNEKGFFENMDLKQRLKHRYGFDLLGDYPEYDEDWASQASTILHTQGYRGGPWLMKHGVQYYKLWDDFTPKFVKIRRDIGSILASYRNTKYQNQYTEGEREHIIRKQFHTMETIPGPYLDYEVALRGDLSQLEDAFIWCGLQFDEQIARNFIEPRLQHY